MNKHSGQPLNKPSDQHSDNPSNSPSNSPSNNPSNNPSNSPLNNPLNNPLKKSQQVRSLLLGGILPVVLYAWIEDRYGIIAGLIAGMVLGVGEILWEWVTQRRVDPFTWGGNGMLLLLGGVSLITQKGIWFKLQPALMEAVMAFLLWGSVWLGKPVLFTMLQKQRGLSPGWEQGLRPGVERVLKQAFQGMTLRFGVFFAIHAGLAVWAALRWSTDAWALLKGVGLTVSLIVYVVVESMILRYRLTSIS